MSNPYTNQPCYSKDICSLMRRISVINDSLRGLIWEKSYNYSTWAGDFGRVYFYGGKVYFIYHTPTEYTLAGNILVYDLGGDLLQSGTMGSVTGPTYLDTYTFAFDNGVLYLIHNRENSTIYGNYTALRVVKDDVATLTQIELQQDVITPYTLGDTRKTKVVGNYAFINTGATIRKFDMTNWSYITASGVHNWLWYYDGEVITYNSTTHVVAVLDSSDLSVKRSWTRTNTTSSLITSTICVDETIGKWVELYSPDGADYTEVVYNSLSGVEEFRCQLPRLKSVFDFNSFYPYISVCGDNGTSSFTYYLELYRVVGVPDLQWLWYRVIGSGLLEAYPGDNDLITNNADLCSDHIIDMRIALEKLAVVYNLNFTNGDTTSNLYYLAMGDRTKYGATGGAKFTWTRTKAQMLGTPTYDIDIGEIEECVTYLENL